MSVETTTYKINGGSFAHQEGEPIPEPVEELPAEKQTKIYDRLGNTFKRSTMPPKTTDVIQVPRWAVGTFGTFILIVGFYAISFYNQTNNKIDNLTEKYNRLNDAQEEKRKLELQEMFNSAVKRGYELKAAEGDHGKEKR